MSLMRIFIFILMLFPLQLNAAEDKPQPKSNKTIISLSATENRLIAQELLTASLRIEKEGANPKQVQNEVNKLMTQAIDLLKKSSDIKFVTGSYYVYKNDIVLNNNPKRINSSWYANQTLNLESKNSDALLELVGNLQSLGFIMNNLSYISSPESIEAIQDEMMVAALKKLQNKAKLAATSLGKTNFEFTEINLNGNEPITPRYESYGKMAMAASADNIAPPSASAGETNISISISAKAALLP